MMAGISTSDLAELVEVINLRVAAWQHFGYENPPTPDSATIPPLGQRSAGAIADGHEAVKEIDRLIDRLHQVRQQLVSELHQNEAIIMKRTEPPQS